MTIAAAKKEFGISQLAIWGLTINGEISYYSNHLGERAVDEKELEKFKNEDPERWKILRASGDARKRLATK
ncbi:MAG: hypothetical protein R3Y50_08740 [Rikenellaceae bacterium]